MALHLSRQPLCGSVLIGEGADRGIGRRWEALPCLAAFQSPGRAYSLCCYNPEPPKGLCVGLLSETKAPGPFSNGEEELALQ